MYQLQTSKNSSNFLKNDSDQDEKVGKNLYLKKSHFDFLDSQAEDKNCSRNQALRDILDREMEKGEA